MDTALKKRHGRVFFIILKINIRVNKHTLRYSNIEILYTIFKSVMLTQGFFRIEKLFKQMKYTTVESYLLC